MSEIKVSDGKDLITYNNGKFHIDCNKQTGLIRLSRVDSGQFIIQTTEESKVTWAGCIFDPTNPGLFDFVNQCHGVNGYWEVG